MTRDKLYIRGVAFTPPNSNHVTKTNLFEGVLNRCPWRSGPDKRECKISGIGCMYGMSSSIIPEQCPIKNATLIVSMNTTPLDEQTTDHYNQHHPDNPIKKIK